MYTHVTLSCERLRQEDHGFEASLGWFKVSLDNFEKNCFREKKKVRKGRKKSYSKSLF